MTTPLTDDNPDEGELWLVYHSDDGGKTVENTRFAIMECLGELEHVPEDSALPDIDTIREGMDGKPYKGKYLYDADHPNYVGNVGRAIPNWMWHYRLPESPDDFDERYEDALDYALGIVTRGDVSALLAGEPSHMTGNRTGYEALRFFALEGIHESITEYSVGHGHGPSRYGNAVENRIHDLPEWLIESALESEKERWEGGIPFNAEHAAYITEILLLKKEYTDENALDYEIRELVNEYRLGYDKYIEGTFTGMDCPACDAELIERPADDDGNIRLDCSNLDCNSSFEVIEDESGHIHVGDQIEDEGEQ